MIFTPPTTTITSKRFKLLPTNIYHPILSSPISMASTTIVSALNLAATRAVCAEFSKRIIDRFETREESKFNLETYKTAVEACLEELGSKPITKAKKIKTAGPSKREIQRSKLLDQIAELGLDAPEDQSITNLKKIISAKIKADKKAERDAAKQAKKEAAAKLKAEKKAAKIAKNKAPTLKGKDYTQKVLLTEDKDAILGENGSKIRVAIHKEDRTVHKVNEDNWTQEAHERYSELYPEGVAVKKAKAKKVAKKKVVKKTKATLEAEQQKIIAAIVSDVAEEQIAESKQQAKQVLDQELELEEEEELEELPEDDEEETPEFPGDEDLEELEDTFDELSKFDGVDFYKDENEHIWDENRDYVGSIVDGIFKMKSGYAPDTDE